ncbi:MAG: acyltransferase [Rhodobiaceae bacterium]|nr:acyltransferase [Rhodobiaceae bacterium]MCC0056836.1 acyltransferase [Rhodobiaceae bacterium]
MKSAKYGPSNASHPTDGPRISHIDGLRAIAVTSVVAYHSGLPAVYGGYVGVDIFFVISGFLIINQIITELRDGRFSLATFYARRSLRILPPFFVMILGSFLIACAILISPFEWEWYTQSVIFSSLFASNFFFMTKQGYFDIGALKKPLLHTWSLSVEEQFYILAPLALMALFWLARRRGFSPSALLRIVALVVFAGSLAGCIYFTVDRGTNRAFYMITWRAWEFIVGGSIAYFATLPLLTRNTRSGDVLGIVGIALIALSVIVDLADGFFPGYTATIPVFGTALVLLGGLLSPGSFVARALSVRPMVAIGLISYSWYLWHWPLMSLASIATFGNESIPLLGAMGLLSLLPAYLSYRFVEVPVRRWRHGRNLRALGWKPTLAGGAGALICILLVGSVGGTVFFLTRFTPERVGDNSLIPPPAIVCEGDSCKTGRNIAGFLEGDSHADHMIATFINEAAPFGIRPKRFRDYCPQVDGMPPDMGDCPKIRQVIADKYAANPADERFWIVERLWSYMFLRVTRPDMLEEMLAATKKRLELYSDGGKNRLLVLGAIPDFSQIIADCLPRAERYGLGWDYCARPRSFIDQTTARANAWVRDMVADIPNAKYVDPTDFFCDDKLCRPYIGEHSLYRDNNHLFPFGARYLYARLRPYFVWAMTGEEVDKGARLP